MKPLFSRITGTALIGASAIGILFSLSGLILLAVYSPRITTSLMNTLEELSTALTVTHSGLTIAGSAVDEADSALESLSNTMESVTVSLQESNPTFTTLSELLGSELPDTISATQTSLESAETSAKIIDSLLTSLSKIPFLGLPAYNTKMPLNETISGISDSLDAIPPSLINAQKSLDQAIGNLDTISLELSSITRSTTQIRLSTVEAKEVVVGYQEMVSGLQEDVDRMKAGLPARIRWATLAAALFLIWLGLAQLGLLTQGLELVRRGQTSRSTAGESKPEG